MPPHGSFPMTAQDAPKLTILDVKRELRGLGIALTYACDVHEFRVNFIGGREATAYYTGDLNDARDTGRAMAATRVRDALSVEGV